MRALRQGGRPRRRGRCAPGRAPSARPRRAHRHPALRRHPAPSGSLAARRAARRPPRRRRTPGRACSRRACPAATSPSTCSTTSALFGRGYLYDPPGAVAGDNLVRFAFLCRGALQLCKYLGWTPDVFHVHDWPSALVPVYLNTIEAGRPARARRDRSHDPQPRPPGEVPRRRPPRDAPPVERVPPRRARGLRRRQPAQGGPLPRDQADDGLAALRGGDPHAARAARGSTGSRVSAAGDLVGILNGIDEPRVEPAPPTRPSPRPSTRRPRREGRVQARAAARDRRSPSGRTSRSSASSRA